jgi:hypothetical protein
MRTERREFSIGVQLEIVRRATDADGRLKCEKCGAWLLKRADYEIDHVISEGIRPAADKKRRLTAADGQLLCTAICHPDKTSRDDGDIAEAKRREAVELGLEAPGKAKIPVKEKWTRPLRVAAGQPALMRRGFQPAGDKE